MKRDLEAEVAQIVLNQGSKKVTELSVEVGVSGATIRKVLSALEDKGVLRRFHGEARALESDEIPFRIGARFKEKVLIAKAAMTFIEPGDTILLEAGSTISILAELLKESSSLTVITSNLFIARMFRGTKVQVIVLGGYYQSASESFVGSIAKSALAGLAYSKAFLGVTGFTRSSGFTLNDSLRAEVTQTILSRGSDCFVLADSSKFGSSHLAPICADLSLIKTVITDEGIPEDDRLYLESSGITVVRV